MKFAVFGCNGFLGRHMVQHLVSKGNTENLYLFDIDENSIFPEYNYKSVNILNLEQVKEINFEFDLIYFFSGLTGTEISNDEADKYIKVNELGLLNVLNCIIKNPISTNKLIFPSTRLIYKGSENELLKEESPKEFKTIYALNKFSCENILKIYSLKHKLIYSIFRIGVPYGNEMDGKLSYGTIGFFLDLAVKGLNIVVYGNGEMRRTFTHVTDICRQLFDVGILENSNFEIFNICGENLSIIEVASMIAQKYNVDIDFKKFTERDKIIESGDTIFDSTKINSLLGAFDSIKFRNWIK